MSYSADNILLIYSDEITPRLKYAFRLIFDDMLGIKTSFTQSAVEFAETDKPKIAYSRNKISESHQFWPAHSILFEYDIRSQDVNETDGQYPLGGDPFASAFYIATRYEEYLPHEKDIFQRFEANQSILHRLGKLKVPIVHFWANEILRQLQQHYSLQPRFKTYKPLVMIDVDQAFSYKHKGVLWSGYIMVKNLWRKNREGIREQTQVLRGKVTDPYDSFDYLKQMQMASGVDMIFFIHSGSRSRYDRPVPIRYKGIQSLIRNISRYAQIGLHPSFQSNDQVWMLNQEKALLQKITGKPVLSSRQHYLRLVMPATYRNLVREGIQHDYSMGYATEEGFRAGMCIPYRWFDIERNEITSLTIHPVCFMEGIYGQAKQLQPQEAWQQMERMIDTVVENHGQPIVGWHNHTITDQGLWAGWKILFEKMITKLIKI